MTQASEIVIGVDCGGTRCRAALRKADGRRVQVDGPGANAFSDPAGCAAAIRSALEALASRAGLPAVTVDAAPAFCAVAGVVDAGIATRLAAALPLRRAVVAEEREAALAGALAGRDGALAAIGTGSFFGRAKGRQARFCGGHGLVLGDEASGAWLGRAALARTLDAADGVVPDSPLLQELRAEFGPRGAVIAHATGCSPAGFARLASRVADGADAGDAGARALMRSGAAHIVRAVRALGWCRGEALVLTGGLGPRYAPYLPDTLRDALADPRGDTLDGALRLAARQAGVSA